LTIGQDFGHVIDQFGNLYGWGQNRFGELGTGDCFPKNKLTQVRVFNDSKQYMRCKKVYNGQSFTLGLFEINANPNFKLTSNQISYSNPVSDKRPVNKRNEVKSVGNKT
jgi:hypothetical protein